MAFFTDTPAAAPWQSADLAPLTRERLCEAMDRANWGYGFDDADNMYTAWDLGYFFLYQLGDTEQILQVQGTWRPEIPADRLAELLVCCNNWSQEYLWPKLCVRPAGDGVIRIYAEHSADFRNGLTDEQLSNHLACAFSSSMRFFETLRDQFPEIWATVEPPQDAATTADTPAAPDTSDTPETSEATGA